MANMLKKKFADSLFAVLPFRKKKKLIVKSQIGLCKDILYSNTLNLPHSNSYLLSAHQNIHSGKQLFIVFIVIKDNFYRKSLFNFYKVSGCIIRFY